MGRGRNEPKTGQYVVVDDLEKEIGKMGVKYREIEINPRDERGKSAREKNQWGWLGGRLRVLTATSMSRRRGKGLEKMPAVRHVRGDGAMDTYRCR